MAGGLLAAPLAAEAQETGKIYRIGYLTARNAGPRDELFEQGLRERGWVTGENLVIVYRRAEGKYERLPALAAELVRLEPQVIVAVPTEAARAAKEATSTIPIVMWGVGDPIGYGLIASLARPGGNVTGVTGTLPFETYTKQLQLLREAVPGARRIALLWNPANPASLPGVRTVEEAARSLGLELEVVSVRAPEEFESSFRKMTPARADALLVMQEALFASHFPRLADLSKKRRLPTMCGLDGYANAGGLMTYSVNDTDTARRVASYVDRLLRGANPADLPVEQPTKFDLVINLKTAKALGLAIPPSLLQRADQVIE
jgi:ABC-type uncharacterized transport system substrate-binding protein